MRAVVLENEFLQVLVLPQKGAEIYSIRYKPLDIDPLLHYRALQSPSPYPSTVPLEDGAFADVYDGGWQVMFPSGGGPKHCSGNQFWAAWRGGSSALWHWQIVEDKPEKISVRFFAHMQRTPFFYERLLSLETGKAELFFEEKITNLGGGRTALHVGTSPCLWCTFFGWFLCAGCA